MGTNNLKQLLCRHAKEIIELLLQQETHFSVQCNASKVQFDPILPPNILQNCNPLIDFILAGYTFESIEIWDNEMSFEAGFGKDNFASMVTIPYSSIIQVSVPTNDNVMRDASIFVNTLSFLELNLFGSNQDSQTIQEKSSQHSIATSHSEEDELLANSKKAILSNPNNKFLKH